MIGGSVKWKSFLLTASAVIVVILVFYSVYLRLTLLSSFDDSIIYQSYCMFPCWRGLMPGVSTVQDVRLIISTDDFIPGQRVEEFSSGMGWFWSQQHRGEFSFSESGILETVKVFPNFEFTMQDVLNSHGDPRILHIRSDLIYNSSNMLTSISFYYPEKGLIVYFSVESAASEDKLTLLPGIRGNAFEVRRPDTSMTAFIDNSLNQTPIADLVHQGYVFSWPGLNSVILVNRNDDGAIRNSVIVTMTPTPHPVHQN